MNRKPPYKTIAFDFDGVIADYHGFKGERVTGDPLPETVEVIRELKRLGHKVLIFSTRGTDFLKEYCARHDIPVDYFNENPERDSENRGKPIATVYVDDRGVLFKRQDPKRLLKEILEFEPHWKRSR